MKSQHSFFDTENHLAKIYEINGFLHKLKTLPLVASFLLLFL
ncbi:MAG: hypothetical protein ACRCUY_03130 [Thermoguttaceae bacterium]